MAGLTQPARHSGPPRFPRGAQHCCAPVTVVSKRGDCSSWRNPPQNLFPCKSPLAPFLSLISEDFSFASWRVLPSCRGNFHPNSFIVLAISRSALIHQREHLAFSKSPSPLRCPARVPVSSSIPAHAPYRPDMEFPAFFTASSSLPQTSGSSTFAGIIHSLRPGSGPRSARIEESFRSFR